jgi:hypothetical protein
MLTKPNSTNDKEKPTSNEERSWVPQIQPDGTVSIALEDIGRIKFTTNAMKRFGEILTEVTRIKEFDDRLKIIWSEDKFVLENSDEWGMVTDHKFDEVPTIGHLMEKVFFVMESDRESRDWKNNPYNFPFKQLLSIKLYNRLLHHYVRNQSELKDKISTSEDVNLIVENDSFWEGIGRKIGVRALLYSKREIKVGDRVIKIDKAKPVDNYLEIVELCLVFYKYMFDVYNLYAVPHDDLIDPNLQSRCKDEGCNLMSTRFVWESRSEENEGGYALDMPEDYWQNFSFSNGFIAEKNCYCGKRKYVGYRYNFFKQEMNYAILPVSETEIGNISYGECFTCGEKYSLYRNLCPNCQAKKPELDREEEESNVIKRLILDLYTKEIDEKLLSENQIKGKLPGKGLPFSKGAAEFLVSQIHKKSELERLDSVIYWYTPRIEYAEKTGLDYGYDHGTVPVKASRKDLKSWKKRVMLAKEKIKKLSRSLTPDERAKKKRLATKMIEVALFLKWWEDLYPALKFAFTNKNGNVQYPLGILEWVIEDLQI